MAKPDATPPMTSPTANTPGAAKLGGTVGSALGVLVVVMAPKIFEGFTLDATEASLLTAALGIIFGFGMQYVPKPKVGGSIP